MDIANLQHNVTEAQRLVGPLDFDTVGIKTDKIAESTDGAGVDVDGVKLKDGGGTFTGAVAGVDGTFTGEVAGNTGVFAGALTAPVSLHIVKSVKFTETAGAGTYTGAFSIPAGYSVLDVRVQPSVLWDNSGTASLVAGDDDDPDGYILATNLKSGGDTTAKTPISTRDLHAKAGAYASFPKAYAAAKTFTATITTSSTGGTAGRTQIDVTMIPTGYATAAVKA